MNEDLVVRPSCHRFHFGSKVVKIIQITRHHLLDALVGLILLGAGVLFYDALVGEPSEPLSALQPGSTIPHLMVADEKGQMQPLLSAGSAEGYLILVFRTDCEACGAQKPVWLQLIDEATRAGWVTLGVTNESLTPHVVGYLGGDVSTFRITNRSDLGRLRTTIVPTTFVIDRRMGLIGQYQGVLPKVTVASIRRLFLATPVPSGE